MESHLHTPRPVSLSVRIYGLLLLAYPSGFRRAYGPDMLQVFADCCRAAYRRAGAGGLPGLWARTMLDYLRTVFEEHIQRGVSMSRETFIKISAWALVVGPIAVLLGWLASTRPDYSPYNAASWPVDRYLNGSDNILIAFGVALSSLGVFGLLARYGARSGRFGQASLLAAAFGGLASTAGSVVMSVVDSEFWWVVFNLGTMLFFLGLVLFAVRCLQRGLFPRLAGLLLGVSIWVPAYMLGSMIYEVATGNWLEAPGLVMGFLLSITFLGLSLVGYQLQRSAAGEDTALQTA
jgi:hypothetical protein